jgi:hypothetical protein
MGKMNRIVKHKWIQQDGFKTYSCDRDCGWIKKWDSWFNKYIFQNPIEGKIIYYGGVPRCTSLMHCGKI